MGIGSGVGRATGTTGATSTARPKAQAVPRADPGDPNRLDGDGAGIACESNPGARDTARVPR